MKNPIYMLLFLVFMSVEAQEAVEGVLLDQVTREPLRYATLTERGLNTGTITNEEGGFRMVELNEGSLFVLSHLGYKDKVISSQQFRDTIYLEPESLELDEVVVMDLTTLKQHVQESLKRNYRTGENCNRFFFKQFLKENNSYVNYLEASGIMKSGISEELPEVWIDGVRKTDNLVTSYVNYEFGDLSRLVHLTTRAILQEGEIEGYKQITDVLLEVDLWIPSGRKRYLLTIDTEDYAVVRVEKDSRTDRLDNKYMERTLRLHGKKMVFEAFNQGSLFEYDFKKMGDRYVLNRLYEQGVGTLVSKDGALQHRFVAEQLYVNTGLLDSCKDTKWMKKLPPGKQLRQMNVRRDHDDWARMNTVLPLVEQQAILEALGRAE